MELIIDNNRKRRSIKNTYNVRELTNLRGSIHRIICNQTRCANYDLGSTVAYEINLKREPKLAGIFKCSGTRRTSLMVLTEYHYDLSEPTSRDSVSVEEESYL